MQVADAIARLGTESAFSVGARARQLESGGKSIVYLNIGEPDFPTAPHIIEAAHQAMLRGETHYGAPLGLPAARESIARYFAQRGVAADPARVAIAPGAKPFLAFAAMAILNPGDEALVPDPGFPIYDSMVNYLGAKVVPYHLKPALGFSPDPEQLRSLVTPRTRLMILNTPHNPTGGVIPLETLQAMADLAIEHNLYVLSDEVYGRLTYGAQHHSIAALPGMVERTVLLDGASKAYAMTGWRLGFAHLPAELVPVIERLLINTVSCTPAFSQHAIIAALDGPQHAVDAMREEFAARRKYIVGALRDIPGVTVNAPLGAFYVFPDFSAYGSSADVANGLLEESGVATLDGVAFGAAGSGHLRISYANSMDNLREAIRRIRAHLRA